MQIIRSACVASAWLEGKRKRGRSKAREVIPQRAREEIVFHRVSAARQYVSHYSCPSVRPRAVRLATYVRLARIAI